MCCHGGQDSLTANLAALPDLKPLACNYWGACVGNLAGFQELPEKWNVAIVSGHLSTWSKVHGWIWATGLKDSMS